MSLEQNVRNCSELRIESGPPKPAHKIVVIQVNAGSGRPENTGCTCREEVIGNAVYSDGKCVGRVLGSRIVDIRKESVLFWFLTRNHRKSLGFEVSFLEGAEAAIVVLESSDRETIQGATDLLRGICRLFSIPIMLVVGGKVNENVIGPGSAVGLVDIASKVISFTQPGVKAVQAA